MPQPGMPNMQQMMKQVQMMQALNGTIPGATLISYPGADHNYITDATEQSNADVLAFLNSVRQNIRQPD